MTRQLVIEILVVVSLCWGSAWGQSPGGSPAKGEPNKKASAERSSHLRLTKTVAVPSEVGDVFGTPVRCDDDGNIYLQNDYLGVSGIHKLSAKGERVANFQATGNPDLKVIGVGYFALDQTGEVYQLADAFQPFSYVLVSKPDGSYKSTIKLQPGFPFFHASTVSVFPSGNLLVSGLELDRKSPVMWPFTGILSSDGTLLKEIKLEDDDAIRDMAAAGDSRVASPTNPSSNRAVSSGQMQSASDGNIYLMRWLSPAIIYAISPGGEVVRRFTIDPGDASLRPFDVKISGNRIAMLFFQPQSGEQIVKIVDLEGHEIATYDDRSPNGKERTDRLGAALACYTSNPDHFVFISADNDGKMQFITAEPR
jgi:hypothetical protein